MPCFHTTSSTGKVENKGREGREEDGGWRHEGTMHEGLPEVFILFVCSGRVGRQ